jgi:ActR/RegA family two-component response regulator
MTENVIPRELPAAARCARALLDRHGIPRYRQSPWLADAFGLSYSQAHRRMNGASPWSLDDLERLGALLGETLAEVVTLREGASDGGMVKGLLRIGAATSIDCRLWLGDAIQDPRPDSLVACRAGGCWVAQLAGQCAGEVAYRIERLEAEPGDGPRKVIAVLDDDRDLTDSVCAHLQASGFEARPFYRTDDLATAARSQNHDGFVIDWIVGDASTHDLIATLRSKDGSCPIFVLSAQVSAGRVEEAAIAEAVQRLDITFSEKPIRMSILSATLARAFAAASPA